MAITLSFKTRVIITFCIAALLLLAACSQSIAEVKKEENIGEKVSVKGTVENTVKFGPLSGYTIKDDTDKITVSSKTLPEEGTTVTIKGTLMKDTLFGWYIKTTE